MSQLLLRTDPTVEAVDGSSLILKTTDLQELAKAVPMEYHDKLQLPFLILRRMEMGRSVFMVAGERLEEFTVQKLLGDITDDFHETYKHKKQMILYRPEVAELVRRFHSLIVIGFGIPKDLADYTPRRD